MKNKTLELLNSEGTILHAEKIYEGTIDEHFVLWDEWCKDPVVELSHAEMKMFIKGKIEITDTNERIWNYAKEHRGMKPNSNETIEKFIGEI